MLSTLRMVSLTVLASSVLLLISCEKEKNNPDNTSGYEISKDDQELFLSVSSLYDDASIPVSIHFPENTDKIIGAVVVMHGSGGPWQDEDTDNDGIADICHEGELSSQNKVWRDFLTANNIVAVFPDSYSPRGTCENEGKYKDPPFKFDISGSFIRNRDAYTVLDFVRSLTWSDTKAAIVDPEMIGIAGFSDGGTAVISTLYDPAATPEDWLWRQSFDGTEYTSEILPPPALPEAGGFKFGIAYYPGAYHNGYYGNSCDPSKGIYRNYAPILFHIAGNDALAPNANCLVGLLEATNSDVTSYYYENADHGFDSNDEPFNADAKDRSLSFILGQFN